MTPMLAGPGALFEGQSVDARSLLGSRAASRTHRPPRPFPGRTFRNAKMALHSQEKVKTLAAKETVTTTKWGSGFVPGIMYKTVIYNSQRMLLQEPKMLMLISTDDHWNENITFKTVSLNTGTSGWGWQPSLWENISCIIPE